MVQAWQDRQKQFQGSERMFYSGCQYNSGASWNWVGFSGTNTGFGTHGNEECNRFILASSGNSVGELSFDGGTSLHGHIYPSDEIVLDGVLRSGCYIRTDAASQRFRVWAW